jgi:hypothetical protein
MLYYTVRYILMDNRRVSADLPSPPSYQQFVAFWPIITAARIYCNRAPHDRTTLKRICQMGRNKITQRRWWWKVHTSTEGQFTFTRLSFRLTCWFDCISINKEFQIIIWWTLKKIVGKTRRQKKKLRKRRRRNFLNFFFSPWRPR